MKTTVWVALALATASAPAAAQALKQRIEKAPDGTVHLTYAARDGVCGNGAGTISFDCFDGNCGRHRITTDNSDWDDDNPCPCDSGPVRLALQVAGGKVTRLRAYVGGRRKPRTICSISRARAQAGLPRRRSSRRRWRTRSPYGRTS